VTYAHPENAPAAATSKNASGSDDVHATPMIDRPASITDALKTVGVSDYLRQMTRVTARLPNPEEAELLRMPRNRPLLVTENINVDRAGAVVEFGVSRYPTPRVQIVFEP